jgi:hypothetical protein
MDYTRIFKRAWHNVRHYRALWIFGAILALTTFSFEAAVFYSLDSDRDASSEGIAIVTQEGETAFEAFRRTLREELDDLRTEIDEANDELDAFFTEELHTNVKSDIVAFLTALVGLLLAAYAVAKVAGYVSETALIRMVDVTEDGGVQHTARQGLRMGWSCAAWRIFLIDLLVNTSAVLVGILLLALAFAPLFLWRTGSTAAGVLGTTFTIGLFLPTLALLVVGGATLSMLKRFFRRVCALEGLGVTASIRRGFLIAKHHLKEVLPAWLVTIGVHVVWPLLVLPVAILLIGAGLLLGGAAALLTGGLASLASDGATPWILAVAMGIPVFLLTLILPLIFLGGLREVFLSSSWTLTYLELRALDAMQRAPAPDVPGVEAATIA